MPNPIVLPYDPTGQAVTNKISDEQQMVTPPTKITDASVVIPKVAPFFKDGLVVKVGVPGSLTALTVDVDYQLVYKHITLSHATGTDVYGGILFKNRSFSGSVWLDYQAIGEPFSIDDQGIVERFSRSLNNVMYVSFEQFSGLPSAWPPSEHPVDGETIYNMANVSTAVDSLAAAINAQNSSSGAEPIAQGHISAAISHTPSQVGLGNLNNWPVANINDYNTGANSVYCNAFGVKAYVTTSISALGIGALTDRVTNLETGLATHAVSIDNLTTQGNTFAAAIDDLEADVDDLDDRVSTNTSAISSVSALVGDQATDLDNLTTQTNTNSDAIAALDGRTDTTEVDIAALDGRVDALEAIPTVIELSTVVTLDDVAASVDYDIVEAPDMTLTGNDVIGTLEVADRESLLSAHVQINKETSFKIKLVNENYYSILMAKQSTSWDNVPQVLAAELTKLLNFWVNYDDVGLTNRIVLEYVDGASVELPYETETDDWLELVFDGTEVHWVVNGDDLHQTPQNPLDTWFNIYNDGEYNGVSPYEKANIFQYDLTGTIAYKEIELPNTDIVAGQYYHIDEQCKVLGKTLYVNDYVQFFNSNAHAVVHKQ